MSPSGVITAQAGTPSRVSARETLQCSPHPPRAEALSEARAHEPERRITPQVVEGIACMFPDTVQSRLVSFVDRHTRSKSQAKVDRGLQCRGCVSTDVRSGLLLENHHCVPEGSGPDACM